MKKFLLTILAIVALSAVSVNAANVVGQLGVLDVTANDGINPATGQAWQIGDTYRLIFITSGTTTAESTDIATYNAFVQGLADAAGLNMANWWVVGSTADVDARDNTLTNPELDGTGEAVFMMDGATVIANNYADLWDGVDPVDGGDGYKYSVQYDENGNVFIPSPPDGRVFTGSNADGTVSSGGQPLGGSSTDPSKTQSGASRKPSSYVFSSSHWMKVFSDVITGSRSVYGMSEPLTIKSVYAAKLSYPEYQDDRVVVANPLTLEWVNPEPNDNDPVYADVWFGTDPCALTQVPTNPSDGLNVTTADVDASDVDTYYWRVDITVGDGDLIEGDIWEFSTTADLSPSVSIDSTETMTWSDEPVALLATVDDHGEGDTTFVWTAVPDGTDDPNLFVDFDANAEDPVLTVTNDTGDTVTVTMTLTATDGTGSYDESIDIDVYTDACEMAKFGENIPVAVSDLNADCVTDINDLALLAAGWLNEYSSTGPQ